MVHMQVYVVSFVMLAVTGVCTCRYSPLTKARACGPGCDWVYVR